MSNETHRVCSYHLHIVAIGETTFERVKRIYANTTNPNDRGIVRNYAQLCCGPVPDSKIQNLDEELSVEQYLKENLDPAKFAELFYRNYGTTGSVFQGKFCIRDFSLSFIFYNYCAALMMCVKLSI